MEIYKNNLEYAKKNGEREQYLQNLELCDKCGAFIRHSIAVNFNFTTKYLDVKTITAEVTEKYGFERTMLMLALRVDSLKMTGALISLIRNGQKNSSLIIPMQRNSEKLLTEYLKMLTLLFLIV